MDPIEGGVQYDPFRMVLPDHSFVAQTWCHISQATDVEGNICRASSEVQVTPGVKNSWGHI